MDLPQSQTNAWRAVVRVLRSTQPAHNLLHSVTSVLFPADCQVCGEPLCGYSRVPVCASCWKSIPEQARPLCSRCGESLGICDFGEATPAVEETQCRPCRMAPPAFARAVACGPYSGSMRPLLHLLKYDSLEPIAAQLGKVIAAELACHPDLPVAPVVVPVPLFREREKQRGFNQSELLARAAIRAMRQRKPGWGGRLAARVLQRSRATQSQAGLSLSERRRNLRGAFFVSDAETIHGRDVLLIDDIYTTGATARACSSALKRAGAAKIWVATVARAQRHEAKIRYEFAGRESPQEMSRDVARWNSTVQ
ncbi:ComF family protein [Silvibacterium bohemicum]|uniref:ComF family protein n=1 Tax=Silvibacterium bohemicum TaxID=1577686 RepID=A0A841JYG6_9BACT|nr:ComF family protein [Silvibacterium bohemicum]MBB6146392.1 ComF family protein [Silvibacterium bohemicum]